MPIERLVFALDGLRRHWHLFLLPLLLALPLAYVAGKYATTTYETKSTILMISANRGSETSNGFMALSRNIVMDQVAVLETWIKSDQVLGELLPRLLDKPVLNDPAAFASSSISIRRSLAFELVGAAVLEVRLTGSEAAGLGRKLEIIITHLLEGVMNPDAGIMSASQMISARRRADLLEAEAALNRAIAEAGIDAPEKVKEKLEALQLLRKSKSGEAGRLSLPSSGPIEVPSAPNVRSATQLSDGENGSAALRDRHLDGLRVDISSDLQVVSNIERLFDAYSVALRVYEDAQSRAGNSISYVRVFDAPERLTVIGRPRDPVYGNSPARKFAIAVMLLATIVGAGLVGVALLLDTRLRVREDFELNSGIPVVARLPKIRRK